MDNMRRCSACRIEKNVSDFSPKANQCKICRRITCAKYRNNNKEKCYLASKKSEVKNPIIAQRKHKNYRENNPEKVKAKHERYKQKHGDRWRQLIKEWAKRNSDRRNAAKMRRINMKRQAMPSWANQEKILSFYTEAKRLTKETGILYAVDHIVPLQGKNVCGLHVEGNLRVIPQIDNVIKGNKLIDSLIYD